MRTTLRIATGLGLVGFGYLLGSLNLFEPERVAAQPAGSDTTKGKIETAYKALATAQDALKNEGKYQPVINGVNSFAVTCGGVNVLQDLEEGRGVDPESFAGLYAGQATDAVAVKLKTDDKGRLTYSGKVVRLYSIERLKTLWRRRMEYSGVKAGTPTLIKPANK